MICILPTGSGFSELNGVWSFPTLARGSMELTVESQAWVFWDGVSSTSQDADNMHGAPNGPCVWWLFWDSKLGLIKEEQIEQNYDVVGQNRWFLRKPLGLRCWGPVPRNTKTHWASAGIRPLKFLNCVAILNYISMKLRFKSNTFTKSKKSTPTSPHSFPKSEYIKMKPGSLTYPYFSAIHSNFLSKSLRHI